MSKQELDLGFLHAVPVRLRSWREVHIVLVGCGGTGSWLAPSIARVAHVLGEMGVVSVRLTFVDHDHIEAANIPRQNFCQAELGMNKAVALALRYSMAWGSQVSVKSTPFQREYMATQRHDEMTVVVGAVDNAAARREIAEEVAQRNQNSARHNIAPLVWWLDCGNAHDSGQVLLGSAPTVEELAGAFTPPSLCRALPMPSLQRPELLEALPDEGEPAGLSCAQMAVRDAQSLMVNQAVAAVASDYLLRLLVTGDLRRFSTYIDLQAGVAKSEYTTPASLASALHLKESIFAPAANAKK